MTNQQAVKSWIENESLLLSVILKDSEAKQILIHDITAQLVNFVSLLSTTNGMDVKIVYMITQEFFKNKLIVNLNIHELKFFLSECTAMRYGKVYHGFGLDVLLDWFEKYWSDREKEFENIRQQQHMERTAHEKSRREAPFMLQSIEGGSNSDQMPDYSTVGAIINQINDKPSK